MNLSKISVKRPISTLMGVLIAISFGIVSILNIKVEMFPSVDIPFMLVNVNYDGAGSEEVEKFVTVPLEGALSNISGLKEISSQSSNGNVNIFMEFKEGTNLDFISLDVREKIDMVKGVFPKEVSTPSIFKASFDGGSDILISAVSETLDVVKLKSVVDGDIRRRLTRQEGVSSISVAGGREKEIQVKFKPDKLRGYKVSETALSGVLASANMSSSVGSLLQGGKDISIRIKSDFKTVEDIKNTAITTSNQGIVYIRDVADVEEVFKEVTDVSYINRRPSVTIQVTKQSDANAISVSDGVMSELEKIKKDFPEITFEVILDSSTYIKSAISSLVKSVLQGGILSVIILFLFLRNIGATLVIGLSMPISIISIFTFMNLAGITINMMSIGGLMLGIGMLVDNSIVVLESIYKKLEDGESRFTAAVEGTREVANSIIASTLTTIAVFLPIVMVGGITGSLFKNLSFTIAFSLTASLIVALTFVPMASSIFLSPEKVKLIDDEKTFSSRLLKPFTLLLQKCENLYEKILKVCLKRKIIVVIVVAISFIITGIVIPTLGIEYIESSDEGLVSINLSLPGGTELKQVEDITWKVVDEVEKVRFVDTITFNTTSGLESGAEIKVKLKDKETRGSVTSEDIVTEIRPLLKNIAGADIRVGSNSSSTARFGGSGPEIMVKGNDTEILQKISDDFIDIINSIEGTTEVRSSIKDSLPQVNIVVDKVKALSYGISESEISHVITTAISGSVATNIKVDGDQLDIRIIQDGTNLKYTTQLGNILIQTSSGGTVVLSEIAKISNEEIPTNIDRKNQQRYITLTAELENTSLDDVNSKLEKKLDNYVMPEGYSWEFGGVSVEIQESFTALFIALIVSVLLVYMIMAAEFESFMFPTIVMFSLPLAMTSGLFGLFLTGQDITVTAILGLIMLSGIVINDAIVLIDYANFLVREKGYNGFEAMIIAGRARFKPIWMTTLTTVISMLPLILSNADGSEMMKGLGIVVFFGLLFATFITLILVPAVFVKHHANVEKFTAFMEKNKRKKLEKYK